MRDHKCGWKRCRQPGDSVSIVGTNSRMYDLCDKHWVAACRRDEMVNVQVITKANPRKENLR